jgi:hypothetical protein
MVAAPADNKANMTGIALRMDGPPPKPSGRLRIQNNIA